MPAATASRRIAYSSLEMAGYDPPPDQDRERSWPPSPLRGRGDMRLVRGKFSHRLGDLVRVRHEELLLRSVERHGRDVRRRDPDHRAVEVAEGVLRDDGGDFGAETPGQVVLVHDHSLAGFADRFQDRVPVEGDRKSTRLNSSHQIISYAVFCLKKKKKTRQASSERKTTRMR